MRFRDSLRDRARKKEGLFMANSLEKRFDVLIGDMQAMHKEMIVAKMQQVKKSRQKIDGWDILSRKVSAAWDDVSVADEMRLQREKQW